MFKFGEGVFGDEIKDTEVFQNTGENKRAEECF